MPLMPLHPCQWECWGLICLSFHFTCHPQCPYTPADLSMPLHPLLPPDVPTTLLVPMPSDTPNPLLALELLHSLPAPNAPMTPLLVGVLGPWTGSQCSWAPSPPATTMPLHPCCPLTPLPVEVLGPYTGAQCGWTPSPPATRMSPDTTCQPPPPPHHQYRHLVVNSGPTAGQHDMSSACEYYTYSSE